MTAGERYRLLREQIPPQVDIVIAAKRRNPEELKDVINAGALNIGYNYVQETENMRNAIGPVPSHVKWHMIGHLQTNKINKSLEIFDMIQTIDSIEKAVSLDDRIKTRGRSPMPILIEINIAREINKAGFPPDPEILENAVRRILELSHVSLEGMMTMGPMDCDGPSLRPWFRETRLLFEHIRSLDIPLTCFTKLSMGMSDSYIEAIEEGSNMIRLGNIIFGERN